MRTLPCVMAAAEGMICSLAVCCPASSIRGPPQQTEPQRDHQNPPSADAPNQNPNLIPYSSSISWLKALQTPGHPSTLRNRTRTAPSSAERVTSDPCLFSEENKEVLHKLHFRHLLNDNIHNNNNSNNNNNNSNLVPKL